MIEIVHVKERGPKGRRNNPSF